MLDDSLMAELFGIILEGVMDGGQPRITGLYKKYDNKFKSDDPVIDRVNNALDFIVSNFADDLIGTPILNAPHFLMFFSAVAHSLFGIPKGAMADRMPGRNEAALSDLDDARNQLLELAVAIDSDEPIVGYEDFWRASRGSTQRIASRRIRFPTFYEALIP